MATIVEGASIMLRQGACKFLPASMKTKNIQKPKYKEGSLEEICYKLKCNDPSFSHLKIGWKDSNHLQNDRDLNKIERAMSENYMLKHISIGWCCRKKILIQFLQLLTKMGKNTSANTSTTTSTSSTNQFHNQKMHLISIEMILNTSIPSSILIDLFQSHKYLESVSIRATNVVLLPSSTLPDETATTTTTTLMEHQKRSTKNSSGLSFLQKRNRRKTNPVLPTSSKNIKNANLKMITKMTSKNSHPHAYTALQKCSIVHILQDCLGKHHKNLKSLLLIDCDITDHNVHYLCNFIEQRPGCGMQELCLRDNRMLDCYGLYKVSQLPVKGKLDLSLCDMDDEGAIAIARGFKERRINGIMGELSLTGNYRIGARGFTKLCKYCIGHVEHLNLSFCDMSESQLITTLREIAKATIQLDENEKYDNKQNPNNKTTTTTTTTTLKQVSLQGYNINSENVFHEIGTLIRCNKHTMECLRFNNPHNPSPLNSNRFIYDYILKQLRDNYILRNIEIDHCESPMYCQNRHCWEQELEIYNEFNFYLRLNDIGRAILRYNSSDKQANLKYDHQSNTLLSTSCYDGDKLIHVLAKATNQLDILYWFIRNSAECRPHTNTNYYA